jgi:large subunit ribosomal protein L10
VKESKKGIEQIEPYLKGMPALLFTKENPFALFKLIKKSKSKAAAKAGQVAPYDLMVSAGPTPFAPGPIISEFAQFKIKTKVVDGKVAIQEDTVVAKAGTVITDKLASLLMRLGIEPMEIGLDLVAIYENGLIYQRNVLDIDEGKFMADLECAARYAFNLSVETGYTTKENIELFLAKANMEAKALGMEANVLSPDTIGDLLAKANNQMLSVKSTLGM